MSTNSWVMVGLGSNQGDSIRILRTAAAQLRQFAQAELRCSRIWCSSPVDCPPDSAQFYNAVVGFAPVRQLTPEQLLRQLRTIERQQGRAVRYQRNTPRSLDLDLLIFGDKQRQLPWITLPHPRALTRKFVLAPAAEILPQLVWPGTPHTVAHWLANLQTDDTAVPTCEVLT